MLQRSLLVVDDDPTLTGELAELLRSEGYVVTPVSDGLEALQLLAAGATPDLILLDMHMEGVDGWDFGAELQQLGTRIPMLVITADENPQRCAAQVGAAAYVAKPFGIRTLLDTVERLLQEHASAGIGRSGTARPR